MYQMTARLLVIMRHAKAASPEGVADIDRPLTTRGHADAAEAGAWLREQNYVPQLVICSPARRTRETWHGVALSMPDAPEVRYDPDVYAASPPRLLESIRAVSASTQTVLLVGHNPTVSQLSILLDQIGADPEGLRTCGIAAHAIEGEWADFAPDAVRLVAARNSPPKS